MSRSEALGIYAELSVGLAGFGGVAAVFLGRALDSRPTERLRLDALLFCSGSVFAGCLCTLLLVAMLITYAGVIANDGSARFLIVGFSLQLIFGLWMFARLLTRPNSIRTRNAKPMHRRLTSLALLTCLACLVGCEDVASLLGLERDPYDANPLAYQDLRSVEECPPRRTEGDKPLSVYRRPPRYPEDALREGLEGRVLVEADFMRDGTLSNPRVIAFEPTDAFNTVALEAVGAWRYCPIADGDPPYPSPFRIAIPFSITGDQEGDAEVNPLAGGTGGRSTY